MSKLTLFVNVILPLPLRQEFTYRVPWELNEDVLIGKRVIVPFGKKKFYTGIISLIHEVAPAAYEAKYLTYVLDDYPTVLQSQIDLWNWMSEYYMCSTGEVMNAALPSGLKIVSESNYVLAENHDQIDLKVLTDKEYLIYDALSLNHILTFAEVQAILGIKTVYPVLTGMLKKGVIITQDHLKVSYKPKKEKYVRLTESADDEKRLEVVFQELERAPMQLNALMKFVQLNERYGEQKVVGKIKLQKAANVASTVVQALVKKNVFEIYEKEIGRIEAYKGEKSNLSPLNEYQLEAYRKVVAAFEQNKTALLHGVTASGKTEVYAHLIQDALDKGKRVLYLLPEIALTTQIIQRLQRYFGDKVGIYHSRYSGNHRVELWNELIKSDKYQVIVGARSSLLLPLKNLDLIIVDEEHDGSFKQYDPAPRYNARDSALYYASKLGANVLLGSATPSIESYYHAKNGKFEYVLLDKRFGEVKLPEILCVDLKESARKKEMQSHFSKFLIQHIEHVLQQKEQVILFQNRRGYNPLWMCDICSWTPKCKNCEVNLTFHKNKYQLQCHYCGFHVPPPKKCGACGNDELKMKGFGTEKIEEDLSLVFPKANIARMDYDSTRKKNSFQEIIQQFSEGSIDILVGTQMVTKGLDFNNVGLVSILNADNFLYFPDFRANERSFQLITQVAGRAGRKKKRGKVIIQTYTPHHWVIQKVVESNFEDVAKQEFIERRNALYPPFVKLIRLTVMHPFQNIVEDAAIHLTKALQSKLHKAILGPEYAMIPRVRNNYQMNILIKIEHNKYSLKKIKDYVQDQVSALKQHQQHKKVRVVIDVDVN